MLLCKSRVTKALQSIIHLMTVFNLVSRLVCSSLPDLVTHAGDVLPVNLILMWSR